MGRDSCMRRAKSCCRDESKRSFSFLFLIVFACFVARENNRLLAVGYAAEQGYHRRGLGEDFGPPGFDWKGAPQRAVGTGMGGGGGPVGHELAGQREQRINEQKETTHFSLAPLSGDDFIFFLIGPFLPPSFLLFSLTNPIPSRGVSSVGLYRFR